MRTEGLLLLFSDALTVSLAAEVQGDQSQQYHDACDTEEVFLRYVDYMSVNIIYRCELRGVLDDKITDECAEEHRKQSKENNFHAFQCTAVLFREEHFDPYGRCLADKNKADTDEEHEEEQMQIIQTEQVLGVDAVRTG